MKKIITLFTLLCFAAVAEAQTYCTPAPTYASSSCSAYMMSITEFHLAGSSGAIYDTMSCTGSGYMNNTSMSCTLAPSGSYTATINTGASYNMNCQTWIDFNNDGTFQSTESVGGLNSFTYAGTGNTYGIYMPSSATSGTYRMRVVVNYSGMGPTYPSIDPCMSGYAYGEGRDYTIVISGGSSSGCSGTPTGGTASASTSAASCAYSMVNLAVTGYTTGSGISLQWQSSPAGASTWTNISGATNATEALASPFVSTDYRCVVSCSSSSMSANSSTATVTIDKIYGHISYSSTAPDTTSLFVWLIYHNVSAGTLTAIDSVTTCMDSLSPYYEFNGMGTGSYLVKAQSLDITSSTPGASGYVPTYGASSPTWGGATTVTHTAGGGDSLHINMAYGTVTSGPGFIGGLISSGAGKGTSGDIPAVHMLVYLKNTASGLVSFAYTDATGAYSFTGIANGSYTVYPEKIVDTTYQSPVLTLTTSHETITGINFKEYTTSHSIKPVITTVVPTPSAVESVSVFPNPTNGDIKINWTDAATGNANVFVTDMAGREVYSTSFSINGANGNAQIVMPGIANGIYLLKIKSASINYTQKLTVQH